MKAFVQNSHKEFLLFLTQKNFVISSVNDNEQLLTILPGEAVIFYVEETFDLSDIISYILPKNCLVIIFGSSIWLPNTIVALGSRTLTIQHGKNPYEDKVV